MQEEEPAAPPRRRRWGLWALAFLTVSLVALLTSGDGYTVLGAVALLGGLLGAAWCSYRGIKDFTWLPR